MFICASELPDGVPMTTVTPSGSSELGQPFNLSCSVTLVERMVVSPGIDYNITWMKMNSVNKGVIGYDIDITTVTAMNDTTTTIKLIFDQLQFEDRGNYICMAELNVTTTLDEGIGFDEADIVVDCKLNCIFW